jgi:hypothetical protein
VSPQAATKPTEKTTPEIFSRDFFVSAGRRGGRPRFTPEQKIERAIARLQARLAKLRSDADRPCRTTRTSDTDTSSHPQRPKQHRSARRSARSLPKRKAAR